MNKTIIIGLVAATLGAGVGSQLGGGTEPITGFDTKGQDVKIQVLIKKPQFQDALYYTPDEWTKLDQKQIDAVKVERFENWKTLVATMSTQVAPEPTQKDLEATKIELERQLSEINAKIH